MSEVFWIAVAAVLFVVLFYKKISTALFAVLDKRRTGIEDELDNALKLKEQAKKLLSEARHKQKNAERQAEKILAHAQQEAEDILKEARAELDDVIERRTRAAMEKIAFYEAAVINDIRNAALDSAVSGVRDAIEANVNKENSEESALHALSAIEKKLN